ncbi:thioredoxin [Methyloprofundus sedimenti]|uniref:Thioredoxin n=2 Tax=Methyloprofundus sedimenti TaxID=1420851 RepID=A0A1V8M334_9GAMM|nr:thioredoxin [Methyloprofundus sedimenti]
MMSTAIFYHAGCPVCLGAEQMLANAIDSKKYTIENVHLGTHAKRIKEAEEAGVKSVPALVLDGEVFHINFGAAIADLKN